ncbi:DUF1622 domain-containing protein [Phenylobacterium sp.]|jgi:uncharacterized membrane protein|uniref:DUF1622 domain-containing protein n=1 Tax=Phenylobacterium sp. TaxID=1871053 RepID=UPI002E34CABE|nr:DUF1622 domain-containing protein [Phenylobacterium sp.]HEX2559098.1 DUF1622 domain-containing protein [Phenylobacterium sp.]
MMELVHPFVRPIADALELAGVAAVVLGVLVASALFVRQGARGGGWGEAYERYRANLGRGILLGLELLVGADIIDTVTAPLTAESVSLLAGIIAIRTFLSFSLETEIEGCWPWQRRRSEAARNSSGPSGAGQPREAR